MAKEEKKEKKGFWKEFKEFITRGNVFDMAVGIIVGGAFTAIVNSLCNNILKPIINWILAAIVGSDSLTGVYTFLKTVTTTAEDGTEIIDLASSIYIDWGTFINAIINFILIALVLFLIIKALMKVQNMRDQAKAAIAEAEEKRKADEAAEKAAAEKPEPAAAAAEKAAEGSAEAAPAQADAAPVEEPQRREQDHPEAALTQASERYAERPQPIRARAASNIEFYDVEEKAEHDGLRITTTNGSRNRTVSKSIGNTFDKGRALFFAAVIVFAIALAECIVNICLQKVLLSSVAYVVLPFVFAFLMLGVFLFLFLSGYGKNSRKTQSRTYISASFVVFANLVLVICLVAYFIIAFSEQDVQIGIQIIKYGIFPAIFAFNIPLFAIFYRYQSNRQ